MKKSFFLFVVVWCIGIIDLSPVTSPVFAAGEAAVKDGMAQYNEENYEEAIEIFLGVRRQSPASSEAAFFLGMSYKQILDFPNAEKNLRDAVTLSPRIKEALLELVDVLYQQGKLDEAGKFVELSEKEGIFPARAAFLKGLILVKADKNSEAIVAFEKSRNLDSAFSQAAEFQIAICLIKDRKLDLAKARLQAVVAHDPLSDLSSFARQYQTMVDERLYMERPLRLTVAFMGGYDSNLLSKPIDEASSTGITDEKVSTLSSSVRLDYVPKFEGQWLFNAQYAAASSVNSRHTHSHDSFSNSFSISPGYNFGRFSVNLNASYTNVLLRTDPDVVKAADSSPGYKRYLDYTSIGPALRVFINQNNIFELFAGYDKKENYNQVNAPDANRDSAGARTYASWIWLFRENSFLNLRYDYTRENADGRNWTNRGNRLTANVSFPVIPDEMAKNIGPITLQLTGSVFFQDYDYEVNYGTVVERRQDDVYTGSAALTWKFWKYASLIGQYTRTENNSNVSIYKYNRDQLLLGLELRY